MTHLEMFTNGYIGCALWADAPDDAVGVALAPEARTELEAGARDFYQANADDLARAYEEGGRPYDYLGHDFWLSRNRHGTGFWDRGLGDIGDRLHKAATVYGSCNLYAGDNGLLYVG